MARSRARRFTAVVAGLAPALLLGLAPGAAATDHPGPTGLLPGSLHRGAPAARSATGGEEAQELLQRDLEYARIRTAPAQTVSSAAFTSARAQAAALPLATAPQAAARWTELTTKPYQSDALGYRDPFWSNSSGGAGLVTGRISALAVDGATVYAGAADGGVWKSTDRGGHWSALFDGQSNLSIGAVAVNRADHSVWVGTGEANTAFENYAGDGIYRSGDGGRTWRLVGNRLDNSLVSAITFDGNGYVLVATSAGMLRRSTLDLTSAWQTVLKPDPNPTGSPYRTSFFTDVDVRPGTHGHDVLAVLGWRGGTLPDDVSYNGFYVSHQGGVAGSWSKVATNGIPAAAIGRTTTSWAAGGGNLFAVVEDPTTVSFGGVFRSASGSPSGPWTQVADEQTLVDAGSALALSGGDPGSQAWYDQYVQVDPRNPRHVYLGLEEVFETTDSGATWKVIGPYWNFPFACWSADPAQNTCPLTTHPDQHAIAIAADGTGYFGNDGGVYRHQVGAVGQVRWTSLNATLRTLQYYYAGIGRQPGGAGDMVWGGLQDNGTSLLLPGRSQMVSPFGGDGGDVLVDPNNGNNAVNEYVYLNTAVTTNGGRSDGTTRSYRTISPSCFNVEFTPSPCDPNPRFIAPYAADPSNVRHWVAGGQYVWDNGYRGFATTCGTLQCDWKVQRDLGDRAQATSLATLGRTTYAGWCGNGCNPGGSAPFTSGIDTNYGGAWHRVSATNLPNRIPTALTIDPANAAHVYVTYGAFSRRWIAGGGVGHVFESRNGGATWRDLSANLPDAPVNDLVLWRGQLVVGTDVGVFQTSKASPGPWARSGAGLPSASTNDLVVSPDGSYLVAATRGRGMWRIS
jgi:hypothetical protein